MSDLCDIVARIEQSIYIRIHTFEKGELTEDDFRDLCEYYLDKRFDEEINELSEHRRRELICEYGLGKAFTLMKKKPLILLDSEEEDENTCHILCAILSEEVMDSVSLEDYKDYKEILDEDEDEDEDEEEDE